MNTPKSNFSWETYGDSAESSHFAQNGNWLACRKWSAHDTFGDKSVACDEYFQFGIADTKNEQMLQVTAREIAKIDKCLSLLNQLPKTKETKYRIGQLEEDKKKLTSKLDNYANISFRDYCSSHQDYLLQQFESHCLDPRVAYECGEELTYPTLVYFYLHNGSIHCIPMNIRLYGLKNRHVANIFRHLHNTKGIPMSDVEHIYFDNYGKRYFIDENEFSHLCGLSTDELDKIYNNYK